MMMFLSLAVALVLLALILIGRPLWRQENRDGQGKGRRVLALVAVVIPSMTFALYETLGAPSILASQPALQGQSHNPEAMLEALETRLKAKPEDAEGWYVAGRAYLVQQRLGDAESALGRAVKLAPKEARYLSHYAEVLALVDEGNLQKRARAWIDAALELDPDEEKALELAGLAAYQREAWAQAVFYWRHLLKRLPPESEFHQDIEAALKRARGQAEHASGLGEKARLEAPEKRPGAGAVSRPAP